MTKSTITRERLEQLADNNTICKVSWDERIELAQIALAAMDSESGCLPLNYLQGHKDGLEWAAQLAEANHPETGDWLYDDPIELAKAIRKGPDMPPVQPVADSEPVAYSLIFRNMDGVLNNYINTNTTFSTREKAEAYGKGGSYEMRCDGRLEWVPNTALDPVVVTLYRHAQQPVVPDESYQQLSELYHAQEKRLFKIAQRIKGPAFDKYSHSPSQAIDVLEVAIFGDDESCRAAMLAAAPQSPGTVAGSLPGEWIPVSERMPEDEQEVLTINRMGHCFVSFFDKHSGLFFDRIDAPAACCIEHVLVTHWMPLPAAQQEVKGE